MYCLEPSWLKWCHTMSILKYFLSSSSTTVASQEKDSKYLNHHKFSTVGIYNLHIFTTMFPGIYNINYFSNLGKSTRPICTCIYCLEPSWLKCGATQCPFYSTSCPLLLQRLPFPIHSEALCWADVTLLKQLSKTLFGTKSKKYGII